MTCLLKMRMEPSVVPAQSSSFTTERHTTSLFKDLSRMWPAIGHCTTRIQYFRWLVDGILDSFVTRGSLGQYMMSLFVEVVTTLSPNCVIQSTAASCAFNDVVPAC